MHTPISKNLLIIFAKNPILGHCKTRLATGVGPENALKIYQTLLTHTAKTVKKLPCRKVVFYSKYIDKEDVWEASIFEKQVQATGGLGHRMSQAFDWGFAQGHKNIVLIGTDLIDLEALDIKDAFKALATKAVVFGPATDGGYYLIGLSRMNKDLFKNIPWSTAEVLRKSLAKLPLNNSHLLAQKNDIDQIEDLKNIPLFLPYISKI